MKSCEEITRFTDAFDQTESLRAAAQSSGFSRHPGEHHVALRDTGSRPFQPEALEQAASDRSAPRHDGVWRNGRVANCQCPSRHGGVARESRRP